MSDVMSVSMLRWNNESKLMLIHGDTGVTGAPALLLLLNSRSGGVKLDNKPDYHDHILENSILYITLLL